jgi:hypothetical protein
MFEKNTELTRVNGLLARIQIGFMGQKMRFIASWDKELTPDKFNTVVHEPRVFIQIEYDAPNTKTGEDGSWKGRKWYLSKWMTDDEIVKTAYLAFRTCIEHEVLESFSVDNVRIFNPHVNFEELIKIAHNEIKRYG